LTEEVPARWRRAIVIATAAFTVAGVTGTALSPLLLVEYPAVLVALSPDVRHLVLTAPRLGLLTLLLIGGSRRILAMVVTYGLGAIYGYAGLRWAEKRYPRLAAFISFFERLFKRVGAPMLIVIPTYTLSALAGVARTQFWAFFIAMSLGQLLYVGASFYFGDAINEWTSLLIAYLSVYMWESTAVVATLVVLQQVIAYRQRKARALTRDENPR
jgi:membrane protein YqaA with SNARE-associated domain